MGYWSVTELAKLSLVRTDVVARVTRVRDRFEQETGESLYVIRGWVTMSSQAQTYADSLAQHFRAAPPEKSYHPKGAAVDLGIVGHVHDDAAIDQADPLYKRLAEIAVEEGLISGYYYKTGDPDPYHVNANETLDIADSKWAAFTAKASAMGQGIGLGGVAVLAFLALWSLT